MRAQDVLPDTQNEIEIRGTTVRKGTVGAFLVNAATFANPALTPAAREAALQGLEALLPALRALGLFEVFEIRDPQLRAFVEARIGAASPVEA